MYYSRSLTPWKAQRASSVCMSPAANQPQQNGSTMAKSVFILSWLLACFLLVILDSVFYRKRKKKSYFHFTSGLLRWPWMLHGWHVEYSSLPPTTADKQKASGEFFKFFMKTSVCPICHNRRNTYFKVIMISWKPFRETACRSSSLVQRFFFAVGIEDRVTVCLHCNYKMATSIVHNILSLSHLMTY